MHPLSRAKVFDIANRLGFARALSPSDAILRYCEQRIRGFLDLCPDCSTPHELLDVTAGMLQAKFETIDSDHELEGIARKYCDRGERAFANLANELVSTTYGVTFRLQHAAPHQPQFICVIDCRGKKKLRRYFTKWHELGHLLILSGDQREFYRSHSAYEEKDPEEVLVDQLASHFGFFPSFLAPELNHPLSIVEINRIRTKLFPDASLLASTNACVKHHPQPHLLVEAKMALSERQHARRNQGSFDFFDGPSPRLRAMTVVGNDASRAAKLNIPRTYRVPAGSVIYRVHHEGIHSLSAHEDLDSWESSDSRRLSPFPVHVEARQSFDSVLAIIRPHDSAIN